MILEEKVLGAPEREGRGCSPFLSPPRWPLSPCPAPGLQPSGGTARSLSSGPRVREAPAEVGRLGPAAVIAGSESPAFAMRLFIVPDDFLPAFLNHRVQSRGSWGFHLPLDCSGGAFTPSGQQGAASCAEGVNWDQGGLGARGLCRAEEVKARLTVPSAPHGSLTP